jgi:hypothetical protein
MVIFNSYVKLPEGNKWNPYHLLQPSIVFFDHEVWRDAIDLTAGEGGTSANFWGNLDVRKRSPCLLPSGKTNIVIEHGHRNS